MSSLRPAPGSTAPHPRWLGPQPSRALGSPHANPEITRFRTPLTVPGGRVDFSDWLANGPPDSRRPGKQPAFATQSKCLTHSATEKSTRLLTVLLIVLLACTWAPAALAFQVAPNAPTTRPTEVAANRDDPDASAQALQQLLTLDAGDGLNQQLRSLVLQHLPDHYVDDRKWNRREEISTLIPRREPVIMNHGTWQKFELWPVDPHNTLAIRLTDVRNLDSGVIAFNLACDLTVDLTARQAKWQRGVQLYSLHADITTRLTIALDCRLGVKFDLQTQPALILAPHVESTQITLHEFRIHRISKVGGELAQQATRFARQWWDEHTAEQQAKLATAINNQIQKKPEKLRIDLK